MNDSSRVHYDPYGVLCQRVDDFINRMLEFGSFPPSVAGTEQIYLSVAVAIPGEADVVATLDDRLALSSAEFVEHPATGEHILSGVRLRA